YLLEEAYETAEAIEQNDDAALREELGDVLLQVVFHARIAQEASGWDIDDVAGDIVDKLVRRHPHVFARVEVDSSQVNSSQINSAADVEANWEQLKATEKGRTSSADGVPMAQPALALASALMGRATKAGLDVRIPRDIEVPDQADESSIGDLLLAVVALARDSGVDPEAAL